QFSWQAPAQLRLPWERDDVLEMLGNVLDNAGKWARSKVQLQITQQGPYIVIHVDDDGPGIELQRREQVQQRGTRLDEQVQGHGLGLGIVRDIVDALAGTLTLNESSLGGLRVTLCLRLP
ncbi:MAG: GHKL domain-containing protein, partial [Gammaproteobacteria bacterium]|nr:GHKL domain-containing protein [Gammaproteobacteria bacterium]